MTQTSGLEEVRDILSFNEIKGGLMKWPQITMSQSHFAFALSFVGDLSKILCQERDNHDVGVVIR
jgi:hypothetical protein